MFELRDPWENKEKEWWMAGEEGWIPEGSGVCSTVVIEWFEHIEALEHHAREIRRIESENGITRR